LWGIERLSPAWRFVNPRPTQSRHNVSSCHFSCPRFDFRSYFLSCSTNFSGCNFFSRNAFLSFLLLFRVVLPFRHGLFIQKRFRVL
jgi:hypothetical protein